MEEDTSNQQSSTPLAGEKRKESISFFISPSALNICIICHEDITVKYPKDKDLSNKLKLWRGDQKTDACLQLEKYFGEEIERNKDFQSICKACLRKIKTQNAMFDEKQDQLKKGRSIAESQFLRSRSRRITFLTESATNSASSKKKRLSFEEEPRSAGIKQIKVHVLFQNQKEEKGSVASHFLPHLNCLMSGDVEQLLECIYKQSGGIFLEFLKKKVSEEASELCKTSIESSFRLSDVNSADTISYQHQYRELESKAPIIKEVVTATAINPRTDDGRNVKKTSDTLIPCISNAVGCLLFARNRNMNANATLNSFILRRSKADKMCFLRFNVLGFCLSRTALLRKQLELGKDYLSPIRELAKHLESSADAMTSKIISALTQEDLEMSIELTHESVESSMTLYAVSPDESFFAEGGLNPIVETITASPFIRPTKETYDESFSTVMPNWNNFSEALKTLSHTDIPSAENTDSISFHPKFMLVGDNVDVRTKRRHYMIDRASVDRHYFNMMAVSNRIPIPDDLIGKKAVRVENVYDIPLSYFLPAPEDEKSLREEIIILVSRDLQRYVEELSWMQKHVTRHIPHTYTEQTSTKSTVFPCGVIDQNENTEEGIIEIMRRQHQLVPGHGSDNLVRTFSIGDLLTVEREQNALENVRDSPTRTSRLEGLIPGLADFHSYGNFMEVGWHILYDVSSSNDIGTLFQARNFLNARAVPASPMKDVNACEELLFKYTEALLLAAFDDFKKANGNSSISGDNGKDKEIMNEFVGNLVDNYILCKVPDSASRNIHECLYCNKTYKKLPALRKHMKLVHKPDAIVSNSNTKQKDCIKNYSHNALFFGYLMKDFLDARKHGDGERLVKLYKYFLVYFKIDGRTKYALHTLHLLAQIKYLLPPALAHEFTWNRFINTRGGIDTNVELDRHLEHLNKYVKNDLAQFQGKITEKSVARCSRSYYKLQNVVDNADRNLGVNIPSGKHSTAKWDEDVKELAKQYSEACLFKFTAGRFHSRFPGFPENYPSNMKVLEFKTWVYEKLRSFSRLNVYKLDDVVTLNVDNS